MENEKLLQESSLISVRFLADGISLQKVRKHAHELNSIYYTTFGEDDWLAVL